MRRRRLARVRPASSQGGLSAVGIALDGSGPVEIVAKPFGRAKVTGMAPL